MQQSHRRPYVEDDGIDYFFLTDLDCPLGPPGHVHSTLLQHKKRIRYSVDEPYRARNVRRRVVSIPNSNGGGGYATWISGLLSGEEESTEIAAREEGAPHECSSGGEALLGEDGGSADGVGGTMLVVSSPSVVAEDEDREGTSVVVAPPARTNAKVVDIVASATTSPATIMTSATPGCNEHVVSGTSVIPPTATTTTAAATPAATAANDHDEQHTARTPMEGRTEVMMKGDNDGNLWTNSSSPAEQVDKAAEVQQVTCASDSEREEQKEGVKSTRRPREDAHARAGNRGRVLSWPDVLTVDLIAWCFRYFGPRDDDCGYRGMTFDHGTQVWLIAPLFFRDVCALGRNVSWYVSFSII